MSSSAFDALKAVILIQGELLILLGVERSTILMRLCALGMVQKQEN